MANSHGWVWRFAHLLLGSGTGVPINTLYNARLARRMNKLPVEVASLLLCSSYFLFTFLLFQV